MFGFAPRSFENVKSWNVPPSPRSGHRIICTNADLYSFGGYEPRRLTSNEYSSPMMYELCKFNFASQTWTTLNCNDMPGGVASAGVVRNGSHLVVYGGTGYPFGDVCNEQIYTCKLEPNEGGYYEFRVIESNGSYKPRGVYGNSIIMDGIYLYSVGGTNGYNYFMNVDRFNMKTRIWENLADQEDLNGIKPRYRHEAILYERKIYVFGGGTAISAYSVEKIPVFDLETREWKVLDTTTNAKSKDSRDLFPTNRKCHSCVQDPNSPHMVYISGGVGSANDVFRVTWFIDLRAMCWDRCQKMKLNTNRYFHAAAVTPKGCLYIFGGVTKKKFEERVNDLQAAWLSVPPLKDICLEAYLSYRYSDSLIVGVDLRKLGILWPDEYYQRRKRHIQCNAR